MMRSIMIVSSLPLGARRIWRIARMFFPRISKPVHQIVSACLTAGVTAVLCGAGLAQDSTDSRLPEAARLALRARAGDSVKMEGGRKITTHIHLEVISSEFTNESNVRDTSSYQFRGSGPNGSLRFEAHDSSRATTVNNSGLAVKPIAVSVSGLYTLKPNLDLIKSVPLAVSKKGSSQQLAVSGGINFFGVVRFPDKALKSGDSWSGTARITDGSELKGITLRYESTLAGFEMYQSFPCARVETNYSYKGPLPGIEAQVRKQLPAGSKVTSDGQLTGTETTYYVLDRGWPLNDQAKITVALNLSLTAKGQSLEVGGTIDTESHNAVVGYPAYDPSLVPKAVSTAPAP